MSIRVNGVACDHIAVRDRGLAYGDGVFRTLRCENRQLWAWPQHFAKLQADCEKLAIACPPEATWLEDIAALAPDNATVKLTVTRGESARGYACDPGATVTRIVQLAPLPSYPDTLLSQGAQVRLCDWPLSTQPRLSGIKHLNRLDQVMARREWHDTNIFDGLMKNDRDEWVEGVISNLFLLHGTVLTTHPLHDCGVAGLTRAMVLDLAEAAGYSICLQAPRLAQLLVADEVFLTNSLAGIVPIGKLGERQWPVFTQTLALRARWLDMARRDAVTW